MTNTALIWGIDGAIGQAIARHLLDHRWKVVVTSRHTDRLEGLDSPAIDADVADPFSMERAVLSISQEVEQIHLWVYAAGDILSSQVSQMNIQEWRRILDANLTGAFLATHHSLPLLSKDAHLFYLGAVSERLRLPGLGAYVAAKAGLEAFAEVVRKESRRKVTVVRPAAVDTPFWQKVPFKLPAHHLQPADVAARIYQAYQEGAAGSLDI